MGQEEPLFTGDGREKLYSHYGNQDGDHSETKNRTATCLCCTALLSILRHSVNRPQENLHIHIYCYISYSSQEMELGKLFANRLVGRECTT